MRLNLGCGDTPLDGYENWDRKNGHEAYPLDVPDDSVDEIRASHILEHFKHRETFEVLANWCRKLRRGGLLKIAVPDFTRIAQAYLDKADIPVMGYVCGGQVDDDDVHKAIFNEDSLKQLMEACGLTGIKTWVSEAQDCAALPISLNLQGVKTGTTVQTVRKKVMAVMSVPRLMFTQNVKCFFDGFPAGTIKQLGEGVYWSQVLTGLLEAAQEQGMDYVFTTDYDTWFTREHVLSLLDLIERHQEYDCVFPVQMRREGRYPFNRVVEQGAMESELLDCVTGHFGLTVFRVSSLAKLKRPWFVGVPGPDGRWQEGRKDADIYFWHNFQESGLRVGLAPHVHVGHLQLLCSWPGRMEDDYKPVHQYMKELADDGPPEWCR